MRIVFFCASCELNLRLKLGGLLYMFSPLCQAFDFDSHEHEY